ncbi:MAG: 4-alpha-glucanotransferase [Candidatus Tectomicrobia bacterium]|nr:4-alpha-glucanotransferase [Candidatus Tectomicrobia bacterium]
MQDQQLWPRSSGILLHLSSLPGGHGIGDLGPAAHAFVDFLAAAGQRWWQLLPISPVGKGNSPYMPLSVFAGSPLFISLERLAAEGLLGAKDLKPGTALTPLRVRYPAVVRFKRGRLFRAFTAFERDGGAAARASLAAFCEAQGAWLPEYALYASLRRRCGGRPWTTWDPAARRRRPAALRRLRRDLGAEISFRIFLQYTFHRQWEELRRRCACRGIGLIGDLPIYVALESADVWANQELFLLDASGLPTHVAGVPPDYFSSTGQLWGNPLYRWEVLRERGYDWWLARFRRAFAHVDAVRLDHFIGFCRYWEVPGRARTARHGRWVEGPGARLFEAALAALGPRRFIAEDLGIITKEVAALRDRFGFPGLRVLQFGFGGEAGSAYHLPHSYPRRCVVYTGTHDNDTIAGWFARAESASPRQGRRQRQRERALALRYLGLPETARRDLHWAMVSVAMMSVADVAIVPMPDLLGLGSEARMNVPATARGNWEWRLPQGAWSAELAARLRLLTETYGRLPGGDLPPP